MSNRMTIDPLVLKSLEAVHQPYTLTIGNASRTALQLERMANLELTCRSLGVKLLQTWALDPDRSEFETVQQLKISFVEYTRLHGFELAKGGHPLEEGHREWATTLKDYYETLYPKHYG